MLFQSIRDEDESTFQDMMKPTGVEAYRHDPIDTLAGGKGNGIFSRRRLHRIQEVLLLDEPTNYLDIAYPKELLDMLKSWIKE